MRAKDREAKRRAGPPPRPARVRVPVSVLVRMFVIGVVAVAAAAYGVYRYYFVPRPPMRVPAAAPEPPATEIPAPELLPSGP